MKKQESKVPTSTEEVRQLYWETIIAMKNRRLDPRAGKEVLDGIVKFSKETRAQAKFNIDTSTNDTPLLGMKK